MDRSTRPVPALHLRGGGPGAPAADPIRVEQVHDGYQTQQNVVRLNGVRGVLWTVLKRGAASTLRVFEGVKKAMPLILSGLPHELEAEEFADQSLCARAAVSIGVKEGVLAAP